MGLAIIIDILIILVCIFGIISGLRRRWWWLVVLCIAVLLWELIVFIF